jgi:myo-inositol-1-phosphate synthase
MPEEIVVGGHEIRAQSVHAALKEAHARAGLFHPKLIEACRGAVQAFQRNVRPGTLLGCTRAVCALADRPGIPDDHTAARAIERLSADMADFRRRHRLSAVVVVHVASAEPAPKKTAAHADYRKLEPALTRAGDVLPASSLYALAALEAGCAYVNFTSSAGINVPAVRQRADQLGLPYMGSDGKTGETLVKSALAPMFAMRNLSVLSWVGQNILGNRDGAILDDPQVQAAKIRAKDRTVGRIVGGSPATRVSIDFVPSLDDWKVAWDFIHFKGFLGTKMSMQFTWQGSDSLLAAPLVLDLARLAGLELQRGNGGPMRHLAFFFKDPIDVDDLDLATQWRMLVAHSTAGSVSVEARV